MINLSRGSLAPRALPVLFVLAGVQPAGSRETIPRFERAELDARVLYPFAIGGVALGIAGIIGLIALDSRFWTIVVSGGLVLNSAGLFKTVRRTPPGAPARTSR